MSNRAGLCPCGSNLAYTKCCLATSRGVPLYINPETGQGFTISSFAAAETFEDLPFQLGAKKPTEAVREAIADLEVGPEPDIEIVRSLQGGLEISFTFAIRDDDYYDDEDSIDYYYEDEVSIVIRELSPEGPLVLEALFNDVPYEIDHVRTKANLALLQFWFATNEHTDPKQIPSEIKDLRREIIVARKDRQRILRERQELLQKLDSVHLESLTLILPAQLVDYSPCEELLDEIPKAKSLKVKAIDENLISSLGDHFVPTGGKNELMGFPDVFFESLEHAHLGWGDSESVLEVAECLRYNFSDATSVSAREILRTPYADLVPPDLMPGGVLLPGDNKPWVKRFEPKKLKPAQEKRVPFAAERLNLSGRPMVPSRVFSFRNPILIQSKIVILDLLCRVSERLSRGEVVVYLRLANGPSKLKSTSQPQGLSLVGAVKTDQYKVLPLTELNFDVKGIFSWQARLSGQPLRREPRLSQVRADFTLRPIEATGIHCLKAGVLDADRGALTLYPMDSEIAELREQTRLPELSDGSDEEIIDFKIETGGAFSLELVTLGNVPTGVVKEELERSYGSIELSQYIASTHPQVHIDEKGRYFLLRRLSTEANPESSNSYLSGFSDHSMIALKTLGFGLSFFHQRDAKDLASKSRAKRPFELKLVKHMGVVYLLVLESLNARLTGTLTDGTPVKKAANILALLEEKMITLILGTLGELSSSKKLLLSDFCSKGVIDKVKKLVSFIFESTTSPPVILPDGELKSDDLIEAELRLIHQVLLHTAIQSGGEVFKKARLNLFEKIFPYDEKRFYELRYLLASDPSFLYESPQKTPSQAGSLHFPYPPQGAGLPLQSLAIFYPLAEHGFEFFFNGRGVEEISEADLKTELMLSDDEGQVPGGDAARIKWFELNPKVFLHGRELESGQARRLLSQGMIEFNGKVYLVPAKRLPSLQKLSSFWEKLSKNRNRKVYPTAEEAAIYPVEKSEVLEMLALRASGIAVIGGERWREICAFYDELGSEKTSFEIPESVQATLKPYQQAGVERLYSLYRLGMGSVLADDMGLGKTLQSLTFLEKLREENEMGLVLIVVPTSLTYNWMSEREKFVPELAMEVFAPKAKQAIRDSLRSEKGGRSLITTYGLLQEHADFFRGIDWNVIIFDEAQNLKTITTQRTSVARSLSARAKICLTGTPLENHLGEFFSLLDLAVPGCLGDYGEFKKIFVNPSALRTEDLQYLKLKAQPLVLRRTKKQILSELPEKTENPVFVNFDSKQKKIYRDIAISYNNEIQQAIRNEGEAKCQLQMFTALLRLRQACSHPGALPGVKYSLTPPKLEAMVEALQGVIESGESALVFTQFLHTLEYTRVLLSKVGIPIFTIHGGVSRSQREKTLKEFHQIEGGAVLLMTLKTGGVGLNLTKASYVFHIEPWWNPAVENQATDRVHRIGQKRSVQVYRYIMHDSVEEKIEVLKKRKQQRFDAVFSESEEAEMNSSLAENIKTGTSRLSKEDFEFLLSL